MPPSTVIPHLLAEPGQYTPRHYIVKTESDPNGVPANSPGAKLDAGKAPVFRGAIGYFPRALTAVSEVSQFGANKYMWKGWETVPDGINRYMDAAGRHILKHAMGEETASDSKLLHLAHAAWGMLAVLELYLREKDIGSTDHS